MINIKLWIDDLRPAPTGYVWVKSVNEAIAAFIDADNQNMKPRMIDCNFSIDIIDIDHDAGDFACDGGDYIKLLDWMEETGHSCDIHIHSMNPVGVANMRAIIQKNKWREIR